MIDFQQRRCILTRTTILFASMILASTAVADPPAVEPGTTQANYYVCDTKLTPPKCYRLNESADASAVNASAPDPLLLGGTTEGKRIYKCDAGYEPPCRLVGEFALLVDPEKTDWAELIAASRAYRSGVQTPIIRDRTGPITQCGPGKGHSACCKIIAKDPITGSVYVECDVP